MSQDQIIIKGAREHNLKNVDLVIPRDKLVVFTGLSGSGKSSLAFDTLFAEGQRRYIESLSSYARQFLGQMDKPDVDDIQGLSPAVSIDQKTTSKNPRSTVGTITEIYDYLRLLYARIGVPHCPNCGREIRKQTVDQIVEAVRNLPEGSRILILAPLIRGRKGEHQKLFEDAKKNGFVRVRIDGNQYDLSESIELDKNKKHDIALVVDRLVVRPDHASRLAGSVELACSMTGGLVSIQVVDGEEMLFSQNYACEECGISIEELSPRSFSFNSPYGACQACDGLGVRLKVDPAQIIPNPDLSIAQGAIKASGWNGVDSASIANMYFTALGKEYGFTLDTPIRDLSPAAYHALLYGTKEKLKLEYNRGYGSGTYYNAFEGLVNNLERRYHETNSDGMRAEIEGSMSEELCTACNGKRLRPEVLAVTVGGINIAQCTALSITAALRFFEQLTFTEREELIAHQILKEIRERLGFLQSVGLSYLTLARGSATLSGGESQRIRLATQIGSSLMGVLYILDEPSIGLHQRDNAMLLKTLKRLRDLGNTLIVVEHDEETMHAADHIVDVGPGAGIHGGEIVAQGTIEDIISCERSVTGQYLAGKKAIYVPESRREGNGHQLVVRGAREHNLKDITVSFPLGTFLCVTGVSGSGKSSLVNEILHKHLASELNGAKSKPGAFDQIEGLEHLDKVICINQAPIGRTPRSNPATYTGLFGDIRDLFAATSEAKARGYGSGRFSFNVKGGRCEACTGDGIVKIEMNFLPDVYVPCEVCKGKRYNKETLEVHYKGKNISEVLDMTVEEGMTFFENIPRIRKKLETLYYVGLSYIRIGQPSTTLSGGEAQRVKLATELSKRSTGKTMYILDEPTTGLHMADVHKLIKVLHKLVDVGNTVLVIEHNLDVIKTADYLVDLGPDGGDGGGEVVACGTPEQVAECSCSYTGQYLKPVLANSPRRKRKHKK